MTIAGAAWDRWRTYGNRLLGNTGFQRLASALPLANAISRRRSRQLFDLLAGFTYSQVLFASVSLGLIDMLSRGPTHTKEIARAIGWSNDRTLILLRAAAALQILEVTSTGAYDLGIHGAALAGSPWIAKFVMHHHLLYADLSDPLTLLRGDAPETRLRGFWSYAGKPVRDDTGDAAHYTALMAASLQAIAAEILASYNFGSHRHLLDAGGGDGSFIAAAAARYPQLAFTLFDLPAVTALARLNPRMREIETRVQIGEGSFLTDRLPQGADVAMLIRVAHDHNDESVLAILQAVREALPPNGRLIVAEPLSGHAQTAPVTDAYFGLYFAAMGQGRTRPATEIADLGRAAGFSKAREIKTRMPLLTGIVILDI